MDDLGLSVRLFTSAKTGCKTENRNDRLKDKTMSDTKASNDKLSRAASAIRKALRAEADAPYVPELAEWEPGLGDRALDGIASEHGYESFEALHEAVAERTSDRWTHFNFR